MEFYASFGKRRLFKLYESAASQGVYINRFPIRDLSRLGTGDEIGCDADKVGCKVLTDDSLTVVNDIENCCIYPIDAPLAYTDEVRDNLQRGRIRFDGISLCPEINNMPFALLQEWLFAILFRFVTFILPLCKEPTIRLFMTLLCNSFLSSCVLIVADWLGKTVRRITELSIWLT